MKHLKEIWRVICFYYSLKQFWLDCSLLALVSIIVTWSNPSFQDKIETYFVCVVLTFIIRIFESLIKPKLLFWKIRKQLKEILKNPNINIRDFDCNALYFWDVEKINKLRK